MKKISLYPPKITEACHACQTESSRRYKQIFYPSYLSLHLWVDTKVMGPWSKSVLVRMITILLISKFSCENCANKDLIFGNSKAMIPMSGWILKVSQILFWWKEIKMPSIFLIDYHSIWNAHYFVLIWYPSHLIN